MKKQMNDRGSILVVVVVMGAILSLLVGVGVTLVNSGTRQGWGSARQTQALYLAEAGIDEAILELFSNPDTERDVIFGPFDFPENEKIGQFTYLIEDVFFEEEETGIKITATGYIPNQVAVEEKKRGSQYKTIICEARKVSQLGSEGTFAFNNALASITALSVGGTAKVRSDDETGVIKGDIYSEGNIYLGGSPREINSNVTSAFGDVEVSGPKVTGNINAMNNVYISGPHTQIGGTVTSTDGMVTMGHSSEILGDVYAHFKDSNNYSLRQSTQSWVAGDANLFAESQRDNRVGGEINNNLGKEYSGPELYQPFPTIDEDTIESWKSKAKSGTTYNSNYSIDGSGTQTLGNTYINGNLKISGSKDIPIEEDSVIYVEGDLELSGSSDLKMHGRALFIVKGTLSISGTINQDRDLETELAFVSLSDGVSSISGTAKAVGAILIPEGTLSITGTPYNYGAIYAKTITGSGTIDVEYNSSLYEDTELIQTPGSSAGSFEITEWREER